MHDSTREPWLRGPLAGVHPLVMPLFFTFAQVREELQKHTEGLSSEQVWSKASNAPSLGFHLKHIAGSVERRTAYLSGELLTGEQLASLRQESAPDQQLEEMLTAIDVALAQAEEKLRSLDAVTLYEPRSVGRKKLPTTVIGLLVHIAEHTQRHLGQAIVTAAIVR